MCAVTDCKVRLMIASADPRTLCIKCLGQICIIYDRCAECASMTEWRAYDAYARKLKRDRKRKSSSRSASMASLPSVRSLVLFL